MTPHPSRPARALAVAIALVAVLGAACDSSPPPRVRLPSPTSVPGTVVPGQPPVVWVSGQAADVTGKRVSVIEPAGSRVVFRRLAEGATRFYARDGGRWARLADADVLLLGVGTPLCVESLLDGGAYLAIRVFVGAACGPVR